MKTALATTHLTLGATKSASSMTVKKGLVISTDPAAGAKVPPGTKVTLVLSSGPPPVTIPASVVGKPAAEVEHGLQTLGLRVKRTEVNDDNVPSGDVVRVDTGAAGSGANHLTVPRGTTVTMVVSKGPVMVKVPYVRFKSLSDAEQLLESAGFTVHVNKPLGFGNTVVAQNPGSGAIAPHGSTVTLIAAF